MTRLGDRAGRVRLGGPKRARAAGPAEERGARAGEGPLTTPSPTHPLPGFTNGAASRAPIGWREELPLFQPISAALIGLGPPPRAGSGWERGHGGFGRGRGSPPRRVAPHGCPGVTEPPCPRSPAPAFPQRPTGTVVPAPAQPGPRVPAQTTGPVMPRGSPPNRGALCCWGCGRRRGPVARWRTTVRQQGGGHRRGLRGRRRRRTTTSTAATARTRRSTAPTGGERQPGPPAAAAAGPIEEGSGREVSGAPPRARADWPPGGILRWDWSSCPSVWLGGRARWLPFTHVAGACPEAEQGPARPWWGWVTACAVSAGQRERGRECQFFGRNERNSQLFLPFC